MPFAGRNHLFLCQNKFFFIFSVTNGKKKEKRKKSASTLKKMILTSERCAKHPPASEINNNPNLSCKITEQAFTVLKDAFPKIVLLLLMKRILNYVRLEVSMIYFLPGIQLHLKISGQLIC